MILSIHIVIALSSIFYTAYVFFHPSKTRLGISYTLVALTIITGTYLVVTQPVNMTQTCETGLVYVGVMLAGIFAVHRKLAAATN